MNLSIDSRMNLSIDSRMNLLDRLVARSLPWMPKRVVSRVARRYIAGQSVDEALHVVRRLRADGCSAVVDLLGENVLEESSASAAGRQYTSVLEQFASAGEPTPVAIKPTHLGLKIDARDAARRFDEIATRARELGVHVEVDMEDSSTTDSTLALYRGLAAKHPGSVVAVQACLKRSLDDVERLARDVAGLRVRVCKGIYREPETIAHTDADAIRASFVELVRALLERGGFVAIATHDRALVDAAFELIDRLDPARDRHEFQMLLGVESALRPRILERGSRLRIYCPFGPEWYAYSLRRLRENPSVAGHVLRASIREFFHGSRDNAKLTT